MPDFFDPIEQQMLDAAAQMGAHLDSDMARDMESAQRTIRDTDAKGHHSPFHGPLATTPQAVEVNQTPGNHIVTATYTFSTLSAQQILAPNPYRLAVLITKGIGGISFCWSETATGAMSQQGFITQSGTFTLQLPGAYTGGMWAALVSAGAGILSIMEFVRTAQ